MVTLLFTDSNTIFTHVDSNRPGIHTVMCKGSGGENERGVQYIRFAVSRSNVKEQGIFG